MKPVPRRSPHAPRGATAIASVLRGLTTSVACTLACALICGLPSCGGGGTGSDAGGDPNADAGRDAGASSSATGVASCTLVEAIGGGGTGDPSGATLELCQEIVAGATASDIEALRQGCVAPPTGGGATGTPVSVQVQAQFRAGPCPHERALGGCRITQGGKTVGNWYYQTGPDDGSSADSIRQLCALAGATFVPA